MEKARKKPALFLNSKRELTKLSIYTAKIFYSLFLIMLIDCASDNYPATDILTLCLADSVVMPQRNQ